MTIGDQLRNQKYFDTKTVIYHTMVMRSRLNLYFDRAFKP